LIASCELGSSVQVCNNIQQWAAADQVAWHPSSQSETIGGGWAGQRWRQQQQQQQQQQETVDD
jgi:hypothetical protein